MSLRSFASALITGVATFAVVTVATVELVANRVAVSLLVALPAGLVAGVALAGLVYLAGREETPQRSERIAGAVFAFAAAFLFVTFLARTLFDLAAATEILIAAAAGVVGAGIAMLRTLRT